MYVFYFAVLKGIDFSIICHIDLSENVFLMIAPDDTTKTII